MPYGDQGHGVSPPEDPYRIERSIFHWVVGRYDCYEYDWYTERRFWKRDNAKAYLVELALKGYQVKF